jgi:hypothetical protein
VEPDIAALQSTAPGFSMTMTISGHKKGMDYNHLKVNRLAAQFSLHADPSNYRAVIAGISLMRKVVLFLKNFQKGSVHKGCLIAKPSFKPVYPKSGIRPPFNTVR